jgi:acyl-CoA reductase-like NAD-dependent aldehyde dehydrogenase
LHKRIKALAAARKSFQKWAYEYTAKERGAILQKWFEIMKAKEQQLAELLTREQVNIEQLFLSYTNLGKTTG